MIIADLKIVMELGSTGAVKSAVEAGLGISFVSASSVKHEVALGLIQTMPIRGRRSSNGSSIRFI